MEQFGIKTAEKNEIDMKMGLSTDTVFHLRKDEIIKTISYDL
jgi:hypothetical protein